MTTVHLSSADQTGRGKAAPRPTMRLHYHCNGLVSPFHLPYQRMAFSGFISQRIATPK